MIIFSVVVIVAAVVALVVVVAAAAIVALVVDVVNFVAKFSFLSHRGSLNESSMT